MSRSNGLLTCPSCGNQYPLHKYQKCLVCDEELIIQSQNNQRNINSGTIKNRSGNTIIGDGNVLLASPGNSNLAKYKPTHTKPISKFKPSYPIVSWISLSFLLIVIDKIGSVASIVSWIDRENIIINQIVIFFDTYFVSNKLFLIFGIFGIFPILLSLVNFFDFYRGKTIRLGGKFAKKDKNNSFEFLLQSKCPEQGCSGLLTVDKAPRNEEGVRFIGKCNKQPKIHTYNFDFDTWSGKKVKLTRPVQKK